ncbi:unnamed protein product [Pleuronectes platessa]|uniref:Uncharacterized protein n=1 Tax=Pleuronectes platessa TaxID=8262 RepID=A0A9N7VU68_PLEPL|nr:unnamed protein product [Pleuronectes platessa]
MEISDVISDAEDSLMWAKELKLSSVQSSPARARSLLEIGLSPGAKRPNRFCFAARVALPEAPVSRLREPSGGRTSGRTGIVMAMTDIVEDDLDERMQEEAEDVFQEDGKLAKGQLWRVRAGVGLQVGCWA